MPQIKTVFALIMSLSTLSFLGILCLVTVSTSQEEQIVPSPRGIHIPDDRQIAGVDWDYDTNGPSTWDQRFTDFCGGSLQSPVKLKESSATLRECSELTFTNYDDAPVSMTIENVGGVSATATVTSNHPPSVSGGCLEGVYTLEKITWHWGETRKQGSEHMLNERSLAMEMQLVHFKTDYGSYEEALKHKDGVTIVAAVYKQHTMSEHSGYNHIANALSYIITPNTIKQFSNPEKLSTLMPTDRDQYYMYEGSTTHPKCEENVTWIVFRKYGKLSHNQVQPFRKLQTTSGKNLVNNYRPLQSTNNRLIYKVGF